ncbi:MAG: replication-associated recombination protein A [Bdellovibrionales bacterium]|nr:replication-associated recombination protein A [Bdellovibrionales bacterium]
MSQRALFQHNRSPNAIPLAERMRPVTWEQFQGIENFDTSLQNQLRGGTGRAPSLILWGAPGTGKTTLAKLIGQAFPVDFVEFSAVLGGVKEIREIIATAKKSPRSTLLFIDEIHRFTKAQQDSLLPHIENGTISLIGATTENPSFVLTNALLSRLRVVPLQNHSPVTLRNICQTTLSSLKLSLSEECTEILIQTAGGDARQLLNCIEVLLVSGTLAPDKHPDRSTLISVIGEHGSLFYDRDGEEHYNLASAFIKSMRATNPDAALYWGFRMLESGEDPRFLFRRLIIFASEDIGNADPRALQLAVAASDAFERIGLPEGRIPLAQCITYLASAPKSNRSYAAMHKTLEAIRHHPRAAVPLHLRNAATALMKEMQYGEGYKYPHDFPGAVVTDQSLLPPELEGTVFYAPSCEGLEGKINEKLSRLRKARNNLA